MIGAVDIATSLIAASKSNIALGRLDSIFDKHVAVFDVDAPDVGKEFMIVVGGPCINSLAAELLDYPLPCNKGFELGKGLIKYFPDKKAILVAGYGAQETLAASYVLADYEDSNLKKQEVEINIAKHALVAINPVIT